MALSNPEPRGDTTNANITVGGLHGVKHSPLGQFIPGSPRRPIKGAGQRARKLLKSSVFVSAAAVVVLTAALVWHIDTGNQPVQLSAAASIPLYSKFEVTFPYSGNYSNPYDPSVVDVEATFNRPDNSTIKIPGFYYQDYTRSGSESNETLATNGPPVWKIRYAPTQVGTYTYTVTLKDASGTQTLGTGTFTGVSSSNPGYIKTVGLHYEFTNGTQFIPLGVNSPWYQYRTDMPAHDIQGNWGEGTYGIDNLIAAYKQYGLNMVHQWTCASFASPTVSCDPTIKTATCQPGVTDVTTLTQMRQPGSWQMDYLVNQAEQNGIYIMPIIKHQDQQCMDPGDNINIRYSIARWGYSPAVMAWDTFKEGGTNQSTVTTYLQTLQQSDPYHHPTSLSQWNHYFASHTANAIAIAANPSLDIVQDHDYSNECVLPNEEDTGLYAVNLMMQYNLRQFGKPFFFGETGLHPCNTDGISDVFNVRSTVYEKDPNGMILEGAIWGEFLSTSSAAAAWDYDIRPTNQLSVYKPLAAFISALPRSIPDAATIFETYKDTSQATVSDPQLTVMGRKNADFAMLRVSNATGTWHAVLMDNKTPTPVSGATATLLNMASGKTFTVKWFSTQTGSVISSETVTANGTNLQIAVPTVTTDIVAYATDGGTLPPPTVSLSASPAAIASGGSSMLTWTATNATSCTASGGWSGSKAISGTQVVSPSVTTAYSLNCTGSGGTANGSATVTITSGTIPGDCTGDGHVNLTDLSVLLTYFGKVYAPCDFNNTNGVVDIGDLSILLSNFGA